MDVRSLLVELLNSSNVLDGLGEIRRSRRTTDRPRSRSFFKTVVESFTCFAFINAVPRRHDSVLLAVTMNDAEFNRNRRGMSVLQHEHDREPFHGRAAQRDCHRAACGHVISVLNRTLNARASMELRW